MTTVLPILLAIELVSGALLLVHYRPGPDAYAHCAALANGIPFGWLVRGVHAWACSGLLGVALFHAVASLWRGYASRQHAAIWSGGWVAFALLMLAAISGRTLPHDASADATASVALGIVRAIPLAGERAASVVGSASPASGASLVRLFGVHLAAACALTAMGALHVARARKDALTSNRSRGADGTLMGIGVVLAVVGCAAVWPPVQGAPTLHAPPTGVTPPLFAAPLVAVLHLFPSAGPLIGAGALPAIWLAALLIPRLPRPLSPRVARVICVGVLGVYGASVVWLLTTQAG